MRQIKLIIFDLDGTLVNAYPAIIRSFNYTMRRLDYPLQKSRIIRRAVGWGDEFLLRPFIREKDLPRALAIYRRHHKISLIQDSRLFPKVRLVLSRMKARGYKLAVASNRPTKFSRILIRHLRIGRYFDFILCGDKLKQGKPHPEILKRIMQRFSVCSGQTLYVGDMAIDAQAGRRAKVKTIMVTTGSSTRLEIQKEKPRRIIPEVADLLKIL